MRPPLAFISFSIERGRFAFVEPGRPLVGDALQRAGEIGLLQDVAGLVRLAVLRELRHRRRILREVVRILEHRGQRAGQTVAHLEAVAGQGDGGAIRSFHGFEPCSFHARWRPADRAGHADRAMAVVVEVEVVLAVLQPHLGVGAGRRRLAEVVGGRPRPLAGAVDEEAAAADVPGGGMRDRQRKGGRHGGVDSVAAALDDLPPDFRGDAVLRHDHAGAGTRRRGAGLQ